MGRSITISTLADIRSGAGRRHGQTLHLSCFAEGCRKRQELDTETLIACLGREQRLLAVHILPRLRCPACGNRDPDKLGLTMIPLGTGGM